MTIKKTYLFLNEENSISEYPSEKSKLNEVNEEDVKNLFLSDDYFNKNHARYNLMQFIL